MSDAWVAVAAGLGGVALGAAATYLTQERNFVWQERQWVTQSRAKVYSDFIAACRLWFAHLLKLAFTIRKQWDDTGRQEWWDKSNAAAASARGLLLQVKLLATTQVASAANDLIVQLAAMNTMLYNDSKGQIEPGRDEVYEARIEPVLDRFVDVARRELGNGKAVSAIRIRSGADEMHHEGG